VLSSTRLVYRDSVATFQYKETTAAGKLAGLLPGKMGIQQAIARLRLATYRQTFENASHIPNDPHKMISFLHIAI
jgi:hypothetical protein